MLRRLIGGAAGAAVAGAAVFGGVSAMGDETKRDEAGVITEAGGLGAFSIRVDDCIQLPDASEVQSVEGVPCDRPHDAQAFATFLMPDGAYPGAVAIDRATDEGCMDRFEAYVGVAYEDSELDFTAFHPTSASWTEGGDREIVCFVVDPAGKLTGEARGSRR